jgi:hypothetical protein
MQHKIIPKNQWPKYLLNFKEIKAIYYGGCPNNLLLNKQLAHIHRDGIICLRYKYYIRIKYLILHELAHILAGSDRLNRWHTNKWRKSLLKLGGTLKPFPVGKRWSANYVIDIIK